MDIGNRIRYLRKLNNLTIQQVSELTGLSQPFISEIERSVKLASLETLTKICTALDISLSEFFSEEIPELAPELRRLLNTAKELTPEQLKAVQVLLDTIKDE